jgi:hypothetical protein
MYKKEVQAWLNKTLETNKRICQELNPQLLKNESSMISSSLCLSVLALGKEEEIITEEQCIRMTELLALIVQAKDQENE